VSAQTRDNATMDYPGRMAAIIANPDSILTDPWQYAPSYYPSSFY